MAALAFAPLRLTKRRAFAAPWRVLSSVRVAAMVILLLAGVSIVGLLVPQVPPAVGQNSALAENWLNEQRDNFGAAVPIMDDAGLFNVFHTWWFYSILGWTVLSIGVCTVNRAPALIRQALHPPHRIAEPLFERKSSVGLQPSMTAEQVENRLRGRWFRVYRETDGDTVYLFADRFSWTALGTFATHAGLILFLIGALVTKFDGFSASLAIAEGQSAPVFPLVDDRHLIVSVSKAVGVFDSLGRPLDFRSELSLVRDGATVKQCTITVNTPCSFDNYRFHQAGFFGYGVDLLVRDVRTGATVYHETLALAETMAAPQIVVTDADGQTIFTGIVPVVDTIEGTDGALEVFVAGGDPFWLQLHAVDEEWQLTVFHASAAGDGASVAMALTETATVGGLFFQFEAVQTLPVLVTDGIPFAAEPTEDRGQGELLIVLVNARFGVAADDSQPSATLRVAALAPLALRLSAGEPMIFRGYEYEFTGQRNFAGILVRKDRGDTLIWIAGGLFLVGLVATLWFPRARAWFRFTTEDGGRMYSPGRWKVDESDFGESGVHQSKDNRSS